MSDFVLRKNQRIKKYIPVRYRNEGLISEGIFTDLSLSGGAISGNARVSVGMAFALQVFVPGDPDPLLINRAIVKWVKGSEFGVDIDTSEPKIGERIASVMSMLVTELHSPLRQRR
jgi:PilZ domain